MAKEIDRIFVDLDLLGGSLDFFNESNIFGANTFDIDRKDQIIFLIALGYKFGHPSKISGKKRDIVLTKYFKKEDMALLYAVAVDYYKDINVISDLNKVFEIAEQYANTGLKYLIKFENETSYENQHKSFTKKIKTHINSINNDLKEDY